MTRTALVVLACLVAMSMPAAASAADEPEALYLGYGAPSACLDAEAFVKEVRARTTRFRLVASADGVRAFLVWIVGAATGYAGDVRVLDREGGITQRAVRGASCDEVVAALAFVMAVSIDPTASGAPAADVTGARPPAASPPPTEGQPAPAVSTGPPNVTFSPPVEDAPAVRAGEPAPPQTGGASPAWHVSAGAGASLEAVAAPGTVAGDFAFAGVSGESVHGLWPELRVAFVHARSGTLDAPPGQVQLEWNFGRVDACPTRWPLRAPLRVRPCARADVGALSASATSVHDAQSRVRAWAALGASVRAEWAPLEQLVLGVEGALSFPVVREQFFIAPAPIVYQAPAVAAGAAVGLAVHFR
jgi:hypothetical protein